VIASGLRSTFICRRHLVTTTGQRAGLHRADGRRRPTSRQRAACGSVRKPTISCLRSARQMVPLPPSLRHGGDGQAYRSHKHVDQRSA
jgi:hypothetical protein